ncbi:MAG TPA: FtsW/RodA/SpoVE family cell cycle protein [Rickettsiales bacterium]|nr:FtsW/RodA/SpoVE family cell cycle protein [Rickettsiales bacterium]
MFDRTKINFIKRWWLSIDRTIFIIIFIVLILGNIFVALASPVVANRIGIATNTFIIKNIIFSILGFCVIIVVSTFEEEKIKILVPIGFTFLILLMIVVLEYGTRNKGAVRWIYLFGFSLQPSEIIKPVFVVLTSFVFTNFKKKGNFNILFATFLYIILSFLLVLQPDIGMLLLLSVIFVVQLFLIMVQLKYFIWLGSLASIAFVSLYFLFTHFHERINTFFMSLFFGGEKTYQVQKSLSAFSNGGFLGKGPLEGSVKNYIPDAHTDFIFSVIGEEFGAIVCIFIISIFFYITIKFILKVVDNSNNYKYLSVVSLSLLFLFQTIINIGVTLNLLPTKGMTLPLISYGGSSMISSALTIGLLFAFTKKTYNNLPSRKILETEV